MNEITTISTHTVATKPINGTVNWHGRRRLLPKTMKFMAIDNMYLAGPLPVFFLSVDFQLRFFSFWFGHFVVVLWTCYSPNGKDTSNLRTDSIARKQNDRSTLKQHIKLILQTIYIKTNRPQLLINSTPYSSLCVYTNWVPVWWKMVQLITEMEKRFDKQLISTGKYWYSSPNEIHRWNVNAEIYKLRFIYRLSKYRPDAWQTEKLPWTFDTCFYLFIYIDSMLHSHFHRMTFECLKRKWIDLSLWGKFVTQPTQLAQRVRFSS